MGSTRAGLWLAPAGPATKIEIMVDHGTRDAIT